jgi:hypothetical protein
MDHNNDCVDLRPESSESFLDMVLCVQAVTHRENLFRIMLKVSNVGTPYRLAVRGFEQNSSFLGATGKRFHSPSSQKPKKRDIEKDT